MSTETSLDQILREWQRRHIIGDQDPLLAVADLVVNTVRYTAAKPPEGERLPTYAKFRETIDQLQRTATQLENYSMDLVVAVRNATQRLEKHQPVSTFALLVVMLLSGAVGFIVCATFK